MTAAELATDPITKVRVRFIKKRGYLATAAWKEFLGYGEQPTQDAARNEALATLASSINVVTARRLRERKK